METLEQENQKNAEMINLKICKKWINGIGLPINWDVLIQVLHDIELHQLANEVEDVVHDVAYQSAHAQSGANFPPIFELLVLILILVIILLYVCCVYTQ